MASFLNGGPTPGHNTDKVDRAAAVAAAVKLGWNSGNDQMLVDYLAWRWEHGEEEAARKQALEYGIDLTSFTRIIAAGQAAAR